MSLPLIIEAKRAMVKKVEDYCAGHPTDPNGHPMSLEMACKYVNVQYDAFIANRKYLASLPSAYQKKFKQERVVSAKERAKELMEKSEERNKRKYEKKVKNMGENTEQKQPDVVVIKKQQIDGDNVRVFVFEGPSATVAELIKSLYSK